MKTVTLYLLEKEDNKREFTTSPVEQTGGAWLGGGRIFNLPEGYLAEADQGCPPVIVDRKGRPCSLKTILAQEGRIYPVLETHTGFLRLNPLRIAEERR